MTKLANLSDTHLSFFYLLTFHFLSVDELIPLFVAVRGIMLQPSLDVEVDKDIPNVITSASDALRYAKRLSLSFLNELPNLEKT